MADAKLPALTETSVVALDDPFYTVDVSDTTDDASGSSRKLSLSRLLGKLNRVCDGRLTLESGVPVSSTDQTAKTTIYFTPYNGNLISIYDGTRWRIYTLAEISLALGTLTSGKQYDVFVYDNSGTLTLELSAAWTNDTTRADALALQDGVYIKSGATTRRHIGTIRTTSTTATEDSGGGGHQAGGKRFVWNRYNQVPRHLAVIDTTSGTWTYGSSTIRQANGAAGNKVEWINGDIAPVSLRMVGAVYMSAGEIGVQGIGLDATNAFSGQQSFAYYGGSIDVTIPLGAHLTTNVAAGYHFASWNEAAISGTVNFYGNGGLSPTIAPGMSGQIHA